jgi:hypothetical protein
MLVKVFFFGKGPGQGQIPGLLGHKPQIPDRNFDQFKATAQQRHNDFSRAHFFLKCALKIDFRSNDPFFD